MSFNNPIFAVDSVSDVDIEGFTFDGSSDKTRSEQSLVVVYKAKSVSFRNVTFRNSNGIALIFSSDVENSGIRDSAFKNIGNRWTTTRHSLDQRQAVVFCCGCCNKRNFVVGTSFSNIGLDAVSFLNQDGFLCEKNAFSQIGAGPAERRATGLAADGLRGGAGIYGAISSHVSIIQNDLDNTGGNGIDLFEVNHARVINNDVRHAGGNGISFAGGSYALIASNLTLDNNQSRVNELSGPQSGIFLAGGRWGVPSVTNVTVARNVSGDDQKSKTQNYGIQIQQGSHWSAIVAEPSNKFSGNRVSDFGEGLRSHLSERE